MRDAVIHRQLQHLRVDHDELAGVGRQPEDQRQDHRVDGDRFAGAGGAGDQQMRHALEIDDDRRPADVLAEHECQLRGRALECLGFQQLAQIDGLAHPVGQFDADDAASGHNRDAHGDGAHGAGDVVGQTDHAAGLRSRRRLQLVERHDRTGPHLHDLAFDAEVSSTDSRSRAFFCSESSLIFCTAALLGTLSRRSSGGRA
jgi:hypothetical protein